KKEKLLEAKDENHRYRPQHEDEVKDRKTEVQKSEHRLNQREDTLDRRDSNLKPKEQNIFILYPSPNPPEPKTTRIPSSS
ncbi:DUF3552 domain-containing protein, partial [Lactobacillus paracasei]|uniref:Rnase Y domain-containing protein n=1 Tax=Lacticaseibacillus paracasei TaxID=1597 RepID=UPI0013A6DFAD